MGYQVGNHCYATKAEAENVYFSLVAPVISTSSSTTTTSSTTNNPRPPPATAIRPSPAITKSTLVKPEYINGKWYLQGTIINANLPTCDPIQNFKDGAELGWAILGVMASCYVILIIKALLR